METQTGLTTVFCFQKSTAPPNNFFAQSHSLNLIQQTLGVDRKELFSEKK